MEMEKEQIKTIDIQAKEWLDKLNGNIYFSAKVILNYGMEDEEEITIPFEYGYGDYYIERSLEAIGYNNKRKDIIVRHSKQTGCKKRELIR